MGPGRLVRLEDVPHPAERGDREPVGEAQRDGAPARLRRPVEGDGRLWVRVPRAAFAGLEGLDACRLELLDRPANADVEPAWNRRRSSLQRFHPR